ncbi:hypothetical protein LSAT2_023950 [Lamellibrachia satsuma]|nr:hypothetical protein LSAT2_023950 [Lamellibrachia satsuma]
MRLVDMDLTTVSDWSNDSSVYQPNVTTSAELREGHSSKYVYSPSTVVVLICMLGTPGNVFVIAVYVRNMTTSTRVYLFALAVVDSVTCVSGIILTGVPVSQLMVTLLLISGRMSTFFSVLLLAFLSTDRLMAVARPHTFSLSASRAKVALVVIGMASATITTVVSVAYFLEYAQFARIFVICITFSSVIVMIVCYTAMAIAMLKTLKTVRTNVGHQSGTQSFDPGPSAALGCTLELSRVSKANSMMSEQHRTATLTVANSNKTSEKQTHVYKGMTLLFTITVVFVTCWMPLWLSYAGVYVPKNLRGTFFFNSTINPFIYCVFSKMFRKDVQQFYRDARSKLTSCHQ